MVTDLPKIVATMPGTNPLVVFHSWVAAYLDEPQQRRLATEVRALGEGRLVHHLYCETPFETPGLPTPPCPLPARGPTWPPHWCTSALTAPRQSGWPTPTRTGTGSAGGPL